MKRPYWFAYCLILFVTACAGYVSNAETEFRKATVLVKASGGWGSGTFIAKDTILTAAHVVQNADRFEIITADGRRVQAKAKWVSEDLDAATLQLLTPIVHPSATIDCKPLEWGEPFSWIGNPSILRWNLMRGYISGDEITNPNTGKGLRAWPAAALFNPGDSGSAVFDDRGRIRGIAVGFMPAQLSMFSISQSGNGVVVPANLFCADLF